MDRNRTKFRSGEIQESIGTLESPWIAKDPSGSGDGWHVEISATDFVSGSHLIAIANAKIRQLDSNIGGIFGNTVPTASQTDFASLSGTTPIKLLSAAVNEGMGTYQFSPDFTLTIPASTYAGVYIAPVTLSIITAP